MLSTDQKRLY